MPFLPKPSITPVAVDAKIGGQHKTGIEEDNMVKIQTGDSSQTEYVADKVEQTYNEIQEYPLWLVIAFALSVGFALPSPLAWWGNRRERKAAQAQIDTLTKALAASQPTYTTKPEGNLSSGSSQ